MGETRSVLAVVAHADDETIGLGGTLARHASAGDRVAVCIMTDGESSRFASGSAPSDSVRARREQARRACDHLGVSDVEFEDFPDNRLDEIVRLDLAKAVERHIARARPAIVYSHHPGDVNVDHVRVSEAVTIATRAQPGRDVRTVAFFETASSTEWQMPPSRQPFLPNWFTDISDHWDAKERALGEYAAEIRDYPHTRSVQAIRSLARWRGASAGLEMAEALVLGRHIAAKGE